MKFENGYMKVPVKVSGVVKTSGGQFDSHIHHPNLIRRIREKRRIRSDDNFMLQKQKYKIMLDAAIVEQKKTAWTANSNHEPPVHGKNSRVTIMWISWKPGQETAEILDWSYIRRQRSQQWTPTVFSLDQTIRTRSSCYDNQVRTAERR